MNIADVIIGLFFVASLVRGVELGLIQQACSTIGLISGMLLGGLLQHHIIQPMHDASSRALLSLLVVLGIAGIGLFIGEYIGGTWKMRLRATNKRWLTRGDKIGGSLIAGLTLLCVVWLLSGLAGNVPDKQVRDQVRASYVVRKLDTILPNAPKVLSRLSSFINPNGFPQVFIGQEPALDASTPLPPLGDLEPAVSAVRPSVVKISGRGCGGIVSGSGFIAGRGLIITNAHVIAGVRAPQVIDGEGSHNATPLWFDPDLDIAVLRAAVSGQPLTMSASPSANGSVAAALGFPGGGDFTVSPSTVLDSFVATGRNIYDQGTTQRSIYSLKSNIQPGNSGGPLITKDGVVTGVIFARSPTYDQVGYALTMQDVMADFAQAQHDNHTVSTGSCTAE